jgi:hypothetical protein
MMFEPLEYGRFALRVLNETDSGDGQIGGNVGGAVAAVMCAVRAPRPSIWYGSGPLSDSRSGGIVRRL